MSSKRIISDSVSADKPELTEYPLSHTTPSGRTFGYTLTKITRKSYSFQSHQSGNAKPFGSIEAFNAFWSEYKAWLNTMNPADVKLLPARVAAVSAPTTSQIIRIDATAAPADVTECLSCHNAIRDGELCPTCDQKQADIVTTLKPRTAHEARNELKRLFVEKMPLDQFKAKRDALIAEISALETAEQVRGTTRLEGECYHQIDPALAIAQFTRKYGSRPTQMLISKYDQIGADVDTTGIKVDRSGSVLPGSLHLSAPKAELAMRPARMSVGGK